MLQNRMVGLTCCVGERRLDVIRFKVGKVSQDFLVRHSFGQHAEHIRYANPQTPDTGASAAFIAVHRDAV